MGEKIGYIQRRSRTITPDAQEREMKESGLSVIYDSLDDAINPASLREGDTLCVWSMGIIGRVNITRAFLAVATAGGEGIYSMKAKRLYPAKLPHAQTIHDAYDEIRAYENMVRSEATKGKSGRKKSTVWLHTDRVKELHADGLHIDDLAEKFKCHGSTIRRIINGLEIT